MNSAVNSDTEWLEKRKNTQFSKQTKSEQDDWWTDQNVNQEWKYNSDTCNTQKLKYIEKNCLFQTV